VGDERGKVCVCARVFVFVLRWWLESGSSQRGRWSPSVASVTTCTCISPTPHTRHTPTLSCQLSLWRVDAAALRPVVVTSLEEPGAIGACVWSNSDSGSGATTGDGSGSSEAVRVTKSRGGTREGAAAAEAPTPKDPAAPSSSSRPRLALFYTVVCSSDAAKEGAASSATPSAAATVKCWSNEAGAGGRSFVVQDVGEVVHSLLWYAEKGQLLVIAASGTLLLLAKPSKISSNTSASQPAGSSTQTWGVVLRAKCASSGGTGGSGGSALFVAWAAPHVLASSSDRDESVRLFDLETEENYALALARADADPWGGGGVGGASSSVGVGSGHGALSGQQQQQQQQQPRKLACLAADTAWGILAAATTNGSVLVYGRQAGGGASEAGGPTASGAARLSVAGPEAAAAGSEADAQEEEDDPARAWELLHCFQVISLGTVLG